MPAEPYARFVPGKQHVAGGYLAIPLENPGTHLLKHAGSSLDGQVSRAIDVDAAGALQRNLDAVGGNAACDFEIVLQPVAAAVEHRVHSRI